MELSTRVNSELALTRDMVLAYRCGPMEQSTRATGETMLPAAEESSITLMEMSMMVIPNL